MPGLEAFLAYDFDNDDRWKDYLKNIEIPGGDHASALRRLKAKWYSRNVDTSFDVSTAVPPADSGQQRTEAPKPASRQPPTQASTTSNASRSSASAGGRSAVAHGFAGRAPHYTFLLNLVVLISVVLYLQPLSTRLSYRAYRAALFASAAAAAARVLLAQGAPHLPLAALQEWAVRALTSPAGDAHLFLVALLFAPQPPVTMALPPLVIAAAYGAINYCAANFAHLPLWVRYGAPAHRWMTANKQRSLYYSALSEVLLGFLLIAQLLTPARSILITYFVWNNLKMQYHLPGASTYHRMAWAFVDQRTYPLRRLLPMLEAPLSFVRRWFTTHPAAQR